MYKIGELSKLCNIPVKTLRYYDSEGILCPDEIDTSTGYRYYSAARLSDCYRILALKELGFTLEEIRAGQDMPRQELADLLAAKSRELSALLDRTQQHIATLRRLSAALEEKKNMYNIIIGKSEEIRIASVRLLLAEQAEGSRALAQLRELLPPDILGSRTVLIDYETEYRSSCFDTGIGVEITGQLPRGLQYSLSDLTAAANTSPTSLLLTERLIRTVPAGTPQGPDQRSTHQGIVFPTGRGMVLVLWVDQRVSSGLFRLSQTAKPQCLYAAADWRGNLYVHRNALPDLSALRRSAGILGAAADGSQALYPPGYPHPGSDSPGSCG